MAVELKNLVECLKKARTNRKELEKKADAIKQIEADLEAKILIEMSAQGLKSVNIEGVARVVSKDVYRYELADIELLMKEMMCRMLEDIKHGRPLSNSLLFQQRLSKSQVEDLLTDKFPQGVPEDEYARYGLRKVEEKSLSLTKA